MEESRRSETFELDTRDRLPVYYPEEENPFSNREAFECMLGGSDAPLVTLIFIAYNNLEKYTKPAMEALLKYTSHIDMELVLVDNGSTDGTLEYFEQISFERKRVCHVTKNLGAVVAMVAANMAIGRTGWGKYVCTVPNDILVTRNWLDNLIRCMEADERVGIAVPMSDYVSNYQSVDLRYTDMEDMQAKAAVFNQTDPRKWEERIRVIPTVILLRNSVHRMYEQDHAFIYYFSDDDLSFQYRRMGYKLMVCGDTFVHHGGSLSSGNEYQRALEKGRRIFCEKYFGIDAWEDTINLEAELISLLLKPRLRVSDPSRGYRILGVDVRCGQPLLTAKNILRHHGMTKVSLSAYISDPKYWMDLKTICDGIVACGELPEQEMFSEIIVGDHLNQYNTPEADLMILLSHLQNGGRLAFKYFNYSMEGKAVVSFAKISEAVSRVAIFKISEVEFKLVDNPTLYREWEMLKEASGKKCAGAKERLEYMFPDSCYFGRYAVGEVFVVIEKIG